MTPGLQLCQERKRRRGYQWCPRKEAVVDSNKTEETLDQKVELKVEAAKDREADLQ